MGWARLDDNRHDHPKILALGDDVYALAAIGLLDHAITWSARHRRKAIVVGLVPWGFWKTRAGKHWKRLTDLLTAANLVEPDAGNLGLVIHDFGDYGPKRDPAEAAESGRKGAEARKANGSYSHTDSHRFSESNSYSEAVADGSSPASTRASPSRPVPSRPVVGGSLRDGPQLANAGEETPDHQEFEAEAREQLAVTVCKLQPSWHLGKVQDVIGLARQQAGMQRTTAAMLIVAVAHDSQSPRRVLSPGYWWDENDTRYLEALTSPKITKVLSVAS